MNWRSRNSRATGPKMRVALGSRESLMMTAALSPKRTYEPSLRRTAERVRTITAGEFKARCLALLDEVAATHAAVVITKRGRPVARVVPIDDAEAPSLLGSILEEHDLLSPIDERWDARR